MVAVTVVVVCLGLALITANGAATTSVTTNARTLHWINAMLGSAAVARAGSAQAVVFAVDRQLGVASSEAMEAAVTEGRETLQAMLETKNARPGAFSDAGIIDSTLNHLIALNEQVLALIASGSVDEAVALSQGEFETAHAELVETLTREQSRISELIDQTEGTLGRMASIASVLVTLLIPAAAVLVYFTLARRQLRERKIAMGAELDAERALSRAKDEFIGGLSHELRTPLTSIYGFSEVLLESGLVEPSEALELISLINTESADLSRMVEDLLSAARIEADALSLEIGELPLVSEVNTVVEPFRRAGLSIVVSCQPATALADRLRFRQVLRNLVSNAQRHGGEKIRIEAREVDGLLTLDVIDDGAGVAPEIADHLFERFIHDGRKALLAGSVGLGLAVARSLMEAMGGTIRYSRVEDHTVFTITLPVAAPADVGEPEVVVDNDQWKATGAPSPVPAMGGF